MTEFAKWRRCRCKQMAFTRKNILFNTNSRQHLPFLLVFCYLASGTYDTPNLLGILANMLCMYAEAEQSKFFAQRASNHRRFQSQIFVVVRDFFYSFTNNFNNVEVWTLGWPRLSIKGMVSFAFIFIQKIEYKI